MGFLRGTLGGLPAILALGWVACLTQAVTFEERVGNVYDTVRKIRIGGSAFDTLDSSTLELSFSPKLRAGKDYKLTIISDELMSLNLQPEKKWAEIEAGSSPKALYLNTVKAGENSLLDEAIQIATIVPTPTITASSQEIFMKTTPKLAINGTNFNMKNTELYFDPPLEEGIKIQKQVLSSNQISLVKKHDDNNPITWTEEPGPLRIIAINTGAGRIRVNPEEGGVTVAEVQTDSDAHDITVQSKDENIYQSTKSLTVWGDGFLLGTKVRFANALRGGGTNFTITDTQPQQLTLTLEEGSTWRKTNPKSLPGALVLLAAEAGAGWVPLGPTTAKAGVKVATVFEDPRVDTSEEEIYRTHTHELMVHGTGFARMHRPKFLFDPPLDPAYTFIEVVNRTTVRLSLSSVASGWTAEENTGPLAVTGVDTGAGMVTFETPITVAKVVADASAHESGVQVYPAYAQPKYQSSQEPVHVMGTGFKGEPVLNFEPPIWSPDNYTLEVVSESELKLTLVKGSIWSKYPGALMLKGINVGDGDVQLAEGKGVKVATIFEDPVVVETDNQIYASHTKHFPVRGSGFISTEEPLSPPTILLDGIPSSNYKIQPNWHNGVFNLMLLADSWADVTAGETKMIKLMSINTGPGDVTFDGGIVIAEVHQDSETALCEDSCSYANDGQCDEPGVAQGSSSWGEYYDSYYSDMMSYQPYGWGYDDDANSLLATNDYSGMYRYAGYETTFHYYGMTDDGFYNGLAPCDVGTDCSDCNVKFVSDGTCTNTCPHARDGICDDPRLGGFCPSGTDCQDCGPWGDAGTNFSDTSFYISRSWFDDDDWEMFADDPAVLYGQEFNGQAPYNRAYTDRHVVHKEAPGGSTIFVDVLWAMVVLVGCSVSLGGCMVAYRHFKAGGGGAPMYLPVQAVDEVELSRRGNSVGATETTPDVVRIG